MGNRIIMTKDELQQIIDKQHQEIAELQDEIDRQNEQSKNGVWLDWPANNHYIELQNSTNKSIERVEKLQESNTELINAIANLNGGVLKDLSQTIVNLTKPK